MPSRAVAATLRVTGNRHGRSLAGRQAGLGLAYGIAVTAAAGLFVHQQRLIRERAPDLCFKAFLNDNRVGAVVFGGIVADYARSA